MHTRTPRISAVIVTRNNRRDIGDALLSLRRSALPLHEVIVIDQASTDDTADLVRRDFPEVLMLDFWDNPGFGEGNNRGCRIAQGEYLLLLNPDAMVEPACLSALAAAMENDPTCGIAVPKTVLAGEPAVLNSAGLFMNHIGYGWDRGYLEWDRGQYDKPEPVLAGSGCALLVRASVFRALAGFDAPYFLYYEDLDLCIRAWLAGHPVHYVPAAVVRHNMKVHARPSFYGDYLDHRNRFRTLVKSFSMATLLRLAPTLAAFEMRGILDLLRRRQWRAARLRLAALTWHAGRWRETLRLRRRIQGTRQIGDDVLRRMMAAGTGVPRARAALPGYPPVYAHTVDRSRLASVLEMGVDDGPALGLGWHGPESIDGRPCRWSCGYGIVYLRAPSKPWTGELALVIRGPRRTEVLVRVNDGAPGPIVADSSAWSTHTVSAAAADGVIRLEILVPTTFTPSEQSPGSPDERVLGVAVASVEAR